MERSVHQFIKRLLSSRVITELIAVSLAVRVTHWPQKKNFSGDLAIRPQQRGTWRQEIYNLYLLSPTAMSLIEVNQDIQYSIL
jgi:hypothetical protein